MRKIRQVMRLASTTDLSMRRIASSVGISPDTVSDYLTRAKALRLAWPLPKDLDDAGLEAMLFPSVAQKLARKEAPEWVDVHRQLKMKGATLAGLHREYFERNPKGLKYSQYCNLYREWVSTLRSHLRQVHVAGERVFVDYAGPRLLIYESTGVREAQVFVGVSGASNYTYVEVHWTQRLADWIGAHVRMFEYFGAVPQLLVCDNLKAGVVRASRTEPEINPTYQNLADHYNCAVLPARPREPTDKAKVENGVLIIERSIMFPLRNRRFGSLEEANAEVSRLLTALNHRPFQKLPGSRYSSFIELDRPAMQPLPADPFEYVEFYRVRVGLDGMVTVDDRQYTVPNALVKQEVELRLTANLIEVLHSGRRVCSMTRVPGKTPVIDPGHLTPSQRYFAMWTPEVELEWAKGVGENVHEFLEMRIAESNFKEQGYRTAGGLKKIERKVGASRLDAACKRALEVGGRTLKSIRSILAHGLENTPQHSSAQEADFDHSNIRGPDFYH